MPCTSCHLTQSSNSKALQVAREQGDGDVNEGVKQNRLLSLLNKLTPEKFEIIFAQILAVGLGTLETVQGLNDQVNPTPKPAVNKLCDSLP